MPKARLAPRTGLKIGQWSLLAQVNPKTWMCRCACGREFPVIWANVVSGRSEQCRFCALAKARSRRKSQHGMAGSDEYKCWTRLKSRGLLDKRWSSFAKFLKDMGQKPPDTVVCRRNGDRPFGPGNAYWGRNWQGDCRVKPKHRFMKFGQQTVSTSAYAKLTGISRSRAWQIATENSKCVQCGATSRSYYCLKCRKKRRKP